MYFPEEAEWRNVGVLNENFISCWCCINLPEIESNINKLLENQSITSTGINDIVSDIERLFEDTYKNTFGFKRNKPADKYSSFKPWLNHSYIEVRNIYHNTRKMYNKYKTNYYKNLLKTVSKIIRKSLPCITNSSKITEEIN